MKFNYLIVDTKFRNSICVYFDFMVSARELAKIENVVIDTVEFVRNSKFATMEPHIIFDDWRPELYIHNITATNLTIK